MTGGRLRTAGFGSSGRSSRIALVLALAISLLFLTPVGVGRPLLADLPMAGHAPPPAPVPSWNSPTTSPPLIPGFRTPASDPAPEWINITDPSDIPLGSEGGGMAYDPVDNETVYFGGCAEYLCFENQTWVFTHGKWTNVTDPSDAPPASWYPSMDFDANMGGVLLYGGEDNAGGFLDTTWLFKDGIWTNLTWVSTVNPPARYAASMAFDPDPEENGSVLFGGLLGATDTEANDTWIWEAWSGWVELFPAISPPESEFASMAYDAADEMIVLFGAGGTNSTWELYSGQWWAVDPPGTVPVYRSGAQMAYDPTLSAVVLFGGAGFLYWYTDTWEFAGGRWTELSESVTPAGRDSAGFALDPSGRVPILFGGENFAVYAFNDTWVFEPPVSAALSATPTATEARAPVTFSVSVSGGLAPYSATFDFGDNTTAIVSSSSTSLTVTHAYPATGRFSTSVTVTDDVGVTDTSVGPIVTVSAAPVASASAQPAATDVGKPVAFSGTTTPTGTPPVNYSWQFGDGMVGYGANVSHSYTKVGSYSANLTTVDGHGSRSTATVTVVVNPLPSVTVAPNQTSAVPGEVVLFSSSLSGGTGPFSYSWQFGDGTGSRFAAPVHNFSSAGTYTVQLWVNDSVGGSAYQSTTFSVGGGSSTSSGGSLASAPLWFWVALAAIILVAIVGTVLLLRRRKGGATPLTPWAPPPGSP